MARKVRVKRWTKELILKKIEERIKKGKSLKCKDVPLLCLAARRRFGSYQAALEKFGLNYKILGIRECSKRWSQKMILKEIEDLLRQGKSLNPIKNKALYQAATKYFGSYRKALERVGLNYGTLGIRESSRKWSKEKIIKELKKIWKAGEPMNPHHLAMHHLALLHAARRYFGSYDKAIEAAGINPCIVRKTTNLKGWIKNLTVEEMQRLEKQILSLNSSK